MFDVRAIGNFILDLADHDQIEVTNMALNKLVYFLHCDYLLEKKTPLVGAKIEAWKHGPVFRELYHEFKRWDDNPIRSRAKIVDPFSGEAVEAKLHFGTDEQAYLEQVVRRYIKFSAAQLRAISHNMGGPWHVVWGHDGQSNPGMRISNELIVQHYSPGAKQ